LTNSTETSSHKPLSAKAPVLLDTDIGTDVDDATALLLLIALGDVDLLSVTTVSGRPGVRAMLARRLLEHAGAPEVPVAGGHAGPLATERFTVMMPGDGIWLGHEGKGVLTDDEIAEAPPAEPALAEAQMITALETAGKPVTVLTIGPLTNLASLLGRAPAVREAIGRIVSMGGVVHGPIMLAGHPLPPMCEFNFNADREALALVLESGVDVTFVPAELTYRTRLTDADVDLLRGSTDHGLADLCALIDIWQPIYPALIGQVGVTPEELAGHACHLHDSAAALAAFRPELFEYEDIRIDLVEQEGQLVTAASPGGAFAVRVASCPDVDRLNQVILDGLLAGAAAG
jgi:purine nucleosidase